MNKEIEEVMKEFENDAVVMSPVCCQEQIDNDTDTAPFIWLDDLKRALPNIITKAQESAREATKKDIVRKLDWRNRDDTPAFYDGCCIVDWYEKEIEKL